MKEIQFNEKKYNIPENWEEVTLGMLMKVSEYETLLNDAPIVSIIAGYTGIELTELKTSRVQEVQEIMETLDFIYTPYEPKPTNKFVFEGVEYMANENIEETEFQDWVSVQTVLYENKNNQVMGLTKLVAIICKKEGESLDDFNVMERAKMFERLPMTIGKDIEGFFLHSLTAYNAITLLYSTIPEQEKLVLHKFSELNDIMKKQQRARGWYSPMRWLIGIYRLYLKFLKRDLERYFNSKSTEISKKNWIMTYKKSLTERFRGNKQTASQSG